MSSDAAVTFQTPTVPIVITGMARAGTSWIGKVVEAGGRVVYINEPLNPRHPPGRSPGVFHAPVPHEYLYLTDALSDHWLYLRAFHDTFSMRYHPISELRRNRSPYDLLRFAKYGTAFTLGRVLRKRPMLDDPFATLSAAWLAKHFGARVAVVVRHPLGIVASHVKNDLPVALDSLLAQPLLMRDWLDPFRDDARRASSGDDTLLGAALLWKLLHHVVAGVRDVTGVRVFRYEDLCLHPIPAFEALLSFVGEPVTDEVRAFIRRSSEAGAAAGAHHWTLSRRGLLSRSAFRPMESHRQLTSWRDTLTPDDAQRVLELSDPVRTAFYPDEDDVTRLVVDPAT